MKPLVTAKTPYYNPLLLSAEGMGGIGLSAEGIATIIPNLGPGGTQCTPTVYMSCLKPGPVDILIVVYTRDTRAAGGV